MNKKTKATVGRPKSADPLKKMMIRRLESQKKRWQRAANKSAGGNLSLWIRETLDAEAKKVLGKS